MKWQKRDLRQSGKGQHTETEAWRGEHRNGHPTTLHASAFVTTNIWSRQPQSTGCTRNTDMSDNDRIYSKNLPVSGRRQFCSQVLSKKRKIRLTSPIVHFKWMQGTLYDTRKWDVKIGGQQSWLEMERTEPAPIGKNSREVTAGFTADTTTEQT